MPKGSAVADVESKLKAEYGNDSHAVFGTLNKIGLMRGNKPTAKGLKPAKDKRGQAMSKMVGKRNRQLRRQGY